MNIAIIDNYHFEVTYTLISLFDNNENNITVFIHPAAYKQLQHMLAGKATRYQWVVKEETETNRQFIHRLFKHINHSRFDLLYFNTIEDNFIHYAYYLKRVKKNSTILTLHDINGFFRYQPSFNARRLVRYVGKKWLIRIVPAFNVLSETLISRLRSSLPASKKIFNIPGSFFDPEQFTPKSFSVGETLSIVIPGSVDTRRRNYELAFDLLQAAQQQKIKISITLLGAFQKGYSENIQQKCNDYLQANDNLHFYESSIVDQPEFDRVIHKSHFIWMPLQSFSTINDGVDEQYGICTCSGNIADIIRHAKPFFAAEQLPLETCLEKSCSRYKTINDIVDHAEQLTAAKYDLMQESARQASLHYTKDNIISRNSSLFR